MDTLNNWIEPGAVIAFGSHNISGDTHGQFWHGNCLLKFISSMSQKIDAWQFGFFPRIYFPLLAAPAGGGVPGNGLCRRQSKQSMVTNPVFQFDLLRGCFGQFWHDNCYQRARLSSDLQLLAKPGTLPVDTLAGFHSICVIKNIAR